MSIAKLIKDKRIEKGLTMLELAEAIDLDFTTISKLESGTRNLQEKYIKGICKVLDISEKELQIMYLTELIIREYESKPYILDALKRAESIIKQKQ